MSPRRLIAGGALVMGVVVIVVAGLDPVAGPQSSAAVPAADGGQRVVVVSGQDVTCLDIDSLDLDDGAIRRLLPCANRPAISADGSRAAVGGVGGLTIHDLRDGARIGAIGTGPGEAFPIAWSPGGRYLQWLVAGAAGRASEVVIGEPSGAEHGQLPHPDGDGYYGSFDWSLNDERFWIWGDDVQVGRGDGTELQPLAIPEGPWDWSPDGSRLLFGASRDFGGDTVAHDLMVADSDGANAGNLTNHPPGWRAIGAGWSPDGTTIALVTIRANLDGGRRGDAPERPGQLSLIDPSGGGRVVDLPAGLGGVESRDWPTSFHWAPDGSRLAIESDAALPGAAIDTYIVPVDGSPVVVLEGAQRARWSSDGRRIVVIGGTGAGATIDVANADGSGRRAIAKAPTGDWAEVRWAP